MKRKLLLRKCNAPQSMSDFWLVEGHFSLRACTPGTNPPLQSGTLFSHRWNVLVSSVWSSLANHGLRWTRSKEIQNLGEGREEGEDGEEEGVSEQRDFCQTEVIKNSNKSNVSGEARRGGGARVSSENANMSSSLFSEQCLKWTSVVEMSGLFRQKKKCKTAQRGSCGVKSVRFMLTG